MVYVDFNDVDGLRQKARRGVQMGYAGKQVIHPNQIIPVQEAFTPNDEEIFQAQRIIQAFEEHQLAGRGAFRFRRKNDRCADPKGSTKRFGTGSSGWENSRPVVNDGGCIRSAGLGEPTLWIHAAFSP
jgi:hypothetical protein